jgi:hypothetical protein
MLFSFSQDPRFSGWRVFLCHDGTEEVQVHLCKSYSSNCVEQEFSEVRLQDTV